MNDNFNQNGNNLYNSNMYNNLNNQHINSFNNTLNNYNSINSNNNYQNYNFSKKEKSNRKKILFLILGILAIIVIVTAVIVFLNLKESSKIKKDIVPTPDNSIKNIYIENNEIMPSFSGNIKNYYVLTKEKEVEIKCDLSDDSTNVVGCNEKISLSSSDYVIHNIISEDGDVYTFNIKYSSSDDEKIIGIKSIEGLDKYSNTSIDIYINPLYDEEYLYSIDNGVTFQESNKFTIDTNGLYHLIISDKNSNYSTTYEFLVDNIKSSNVNSKLYISKSSKNQVVLKVLSDVSVEYSWNDGDYTKKDSYNVNEPGMYTVTLIDKYGNVSNELSINVKESDFYDRKVNSVVIYNNGNQVSNSFLTCTDNGNGCTVTLPTISRDGYTDVGFSVSERNYKAKYQSNEKIIITKDLKLYANTSKNVTINYISNGNSISNLKDSCTKYNDSYCLIDAPDFTSQAGEVLGWNIRNVSSPLYTAGSKVKVYEDMDLYALAFSSIEVKFLENGADSISTKSIKIKYLVGSDGSEVHMPQIKKKNSEIIGWNTDKNATTSLYKVGDIVYIKDDVSLYAITKMTVNVTFEKNGADSISKNIVTCDYYNTLKNCKITTPSIKRKSSAIYGWSTDKGAHTASVSQNQEITVDKDITYYAISSVNVNINFNSNGANIDKSNLNCTYFNDSGSCSIKTPSISRSGYKVLGWGESISAKNAVYSQNSTIKVSKSTTYYAVTYKTITAQFNTYSADSLFGCKTKNSSGCSDSCTLYNKSSTCKVTLPYIHSKGNEVQLFSTGTDVSTTSGYIPGLSINIGSNITLYAIVRNDYRKSTFSISSNKTLGSVMVEVESGCSSTIANKYMSFITKFYSKAPYVFTAAKMTFVGQTSYTNTWGSESAGMTYGKNVGYRNSDIMCPSSYNDYYLKTIVHEMTHAWDSYYKARYGSYLSYASDISSLYSKYSSASTKPLRSYSYSSRFEFIADMYSWYYFLYIDPSSMPNVVKENTYYPSDMKKVMEKYIKIAKNGYS